MSTDNLTGPLAAALAAFAPERSIVDVLLPYAAPTAATPQLKIGPTAGAAATAVEHNAGLAVFLAGAEHTDPKVLAVLAHSPSTAVRRAVAKHPDLPADAGAYLAEWAIAEKDQVTLQSLARTLRPSAYLPALATVMGSQFKTEGIIENLAGRNAAEVTATFQLGMLHVQRAIIRAAVAGALDANPAALIRETEGDVRLSLLDAVISADWGVPLPDDVEDLIADSVASADAASQPERQVDIGMALVHRAAMARLLSPYAVRRYIASGNTTLVACVAASQHAGRAAVPDELLGELVAQVVAAGDAMCVAVVLAANADRLSNQQIAQLAPMSAPVFDQTQDLPRTFRAALTRLPVDTVAALLRLLPAKAAVTWLCTEKNVGRVTRVLTELAADSGASMLDKSPSRFEAVKPALAVPLGEYIGALNATGWQPERRQLTAEVRDTLLDIAGPYTFHLAAVRDIRAGLLTSAGAAEYVTRRLYERFGTRPMPWRLAATVAGVLNGGTISDWLDVVAALSDDEVHAFRRDAA